MKTLLRTSIEPADIHTITKEYSMKKDAGRVEIRIEKKASVDQLIQVFDKGYDSPSSEKYFSKSIYKEDTDMVDLSMSIDSDDQGEFVLTVLQYDDEKRILNDNKTFKIKKGQNKLSISSVRHIRAKSFKIRLKFGLGPISFSINEAIIWQNSALSPDFIEWNRIQRVRDRSNLLRDHPRSNIGHEIVVHNPSSNNYDFKKERNGYDHLVSVIVPIYNTSDYLPKCIQSLLDQTIGDVEIILINDGSKDNSLEIMRSYQAKYPDQIKIIDQENQGLGATRNNGIRAAKGRYIMFLDSDDAYTPNACEALFWVAKRYDCDMVIGRIAWDEDGNITPQENIDKKLSKHLGRRFVNLRKDTGAVFVNVVCTLYSSELLKENGIFFPERIIWEDMPFALQAWQHSKMIGLCSDIVYLRSSREGSISKTYSYRQIFDKVRISKMISSRFDEYGLHSMYKYFEWTIKDIDERIELIESPIDKEKALTLWATEKPALEQLQKHHENMYAKKKG